MSGLNTLCLFWTQVCHRIGNNAFFRQQRRPRRIPNHPKPSQTTDDDSELRDEKAAYNKAKKRCRLFTSTPTEVQCLGQLIITFGKYNGKSFKWLVENDVGYIKYVLDRHVKESRQPERRAINEK